MKITMHQSKDSSEKEKTRKPCTASCEWFQYSSHPDLVHKCNQ